MSKKKIIIGIVGIIVLLIVGFGIYFAIKNQATGDTKKMKDEYESLNASTGINVKIDSKVEIKYVTIEEAIERLKTGTGILYFGFPKCPWCRNILPVLAETARENKEVIYYFNPSDVRDKGNESYKKLVEVLKSYLEKDEEGVSTLYVPDVYFVKNGKIMGHQLSSVEGQTNPNVPLTSNQRQELKKIYQNLINQIK